MFQHRENSADDRRGYYSVQKREGALNTDHSPVIGRRREEVERADETKGQGEQPDSDAHTEPGSYQTAALPHLQGECNRGESTDQSDNEQRSVEPSEKNTAPTTSGDSGQHPKIPAHHH